MRATAPPDALRASMSVRTSSRSFFGLRVEEYWLSPSRRRGDVAQATKDAISLGRRRADLRFLHRRSLQFLELLLELLDQAERLERLQPREPRRPGERVLLDGEGDRGSWPEARSGAVFHF